ncbi:hypothetical protein [Aureimonas psammosilenae]|uniref:hypothetical protein n=1 Tax=Aureimonas psammosilenae TaxID=2495496 RepID=UPI0012607455|nr:hypothetical protein [Aureimonas psammosilenae]
MRFNWLFTLSVCISVGVVMASMYAGFESVKTSYTQQIADLQAELKEAKAKIKTLEDNQIIVYQTDSEDSNP